MRLHTHLGVPLAKVTHLLRTQFGLTVTPGAQVLLRQAAPTYTALCQQNLPWSRRMKRLARRRHAWLWVFATPQTTVYAIRAGRGFDDAATVHRLHGVLGDGWAPYRRFTHALHRLAHLMRRARQLRTDHPRSPWAARVHAVLAGRLRDRRDAGLLSDHGLASRLLDGSTKRRRWTPPTA